MTALQRLNGASLSIIFRIDFSRFPDPPKAANFTTGHDYCDGNRFGMDTQPYKASFRHERRFFRVRLD
jgi:hypothetical protein